MSHNMGFRTAGNRSLVAPSNAAMQRAMALVLSQSENAEASSSSSVAVKVEGNHLPPDEAQSGPFRGFAGFKSAKGDFIAPSEAALVAARRLFTEVENDMEGAEPRRAASPSVSGTGLARSHETTPMRRQVRPISRFSTPGPSARTPLRLVQDTKSSTLGPSNLGKLASEGLGSGAGSNINAFEQHPVPLACGSEAMVPESAGPQRSKTPARPNPCPYPQQQTNQSTQTGYSSPRPMRPLSSTPVAAKKICLGTTPRSQRLRDSGSVSRPQFRTPFKNGARPGPSSPFRTPSSASRRPNPVYPPPSGASQSRPIPSRRPSSRGTQASPPVFNLQTSTKRLTLAQYGIVPEGVSPLQAIARGVPDEVLVILDDSSKAALYAFDSPDGQLLGPTEALAELQSRGCSFVDLAWVRNHWSLILWKMAALARHRPDEAGWHWNWHEVVKQLLYRYEREVNLAQRSCIKRIQEHDSSPASPMILFVAKTLDYQDDECDESGNRPPPEIMLELSDGWYRIRANLDPTLSAAVLRGRIHVGHKLAIMGAKLQSSGDGTEVLVALLTSTLALNGNSVSLARWDARLGFTRDRFFASLRSLTPEGGIVSCMDIVITKIFPLAYMDVEQGGQSVRGEAEEAEEREAWQRRLEDAQVRLEAKFSERGRKLESIMFALESGCEGTVEQGLGSNALSNLEDEALSVLYAIEEHDDPLSALKAMVLAPGWTRLLAPLISLVRSRLAADVDEDRFLLQKELEKACPPRRVRDFRVVKFRDARLPPPGQPRAKNPHARAVQLTVWDARSLGSSLKEGERFVVTNLVPNSKRAWRKADEEADIFLSTRRDTRWKPVDNTGR